MMLLLRYSSPSSLLRLCSSSKQHSTRFIHQCLIASSTFITSSHSFTLIQPHPLQSSSSWRIPWNQSCRLLSQDTQQTPPPPPAAASTPQQEGQLGQQGDHTSNRSSLDNNVANHTTVVAVASGDPAEVRVQNEESVEEGDEVLYKRVELEVLAYEPSVLDSYQWFVCSSAGYLGIPIGKVWSPHKSDKNRFPLLKSAFVHKKHQVHYEIRTYHRFITLHNLTSSTASTFLEYIQRNLPEGCGLKVTKVQVLPIPKFLLPHQNP